MVGMSTSSEALPPVRVTDLVQFCELIPLMLRFQPRESLVAIVLRDGQMIVAARFDIPTTTDTVVEVTRRCAELAMRHDCELLVLLGFTADPGALWDVLDTVQTGVFPIPTEVLVTDHHRCWRAPDDAGVDLPSDSGLREHAEFAERAVLNDREALAETVAGPSCIDQAMEDALDRAEHFVMHLTIPEQMNLVHDLVGELVGGSRQVNVESALIIAALVEDPFVREHVRLLVRRDTAEDHLRFWHQVVAVAPDEVATGALCLLAMAAFLTGDGALQQVCVERAELLASDDEMVAHLVMLNEEAVDPRQWDRRVG